MTLVEKVRQAKGKYLPVCPAHANRVCRGHCGGQQFKCVRCGRWRPFCFGGTDSLACTSCWAKFRERVVAFVRQKSWRSEVTILQRFELENGDQTLTSVFIKETLRDLVQLGQLEWLGVDDKSEPNKALGVLLKYRVKR